MVRETSPKTGLKQAPCYSWDEQDEEIVITNYVTGLGGTVSSHEGAYEFCRQRAEYMDPWFLLKCFLQTGEWVRVERIKIRKTKWLGHFDSFVTQCKHPYYIKEKLCTNFETMPMCWNDSSGFSEFNVRSLAYWPCKTLWEHLQCITPGNRTSNIGL